MKKYENVNLPRVFNITGGLTCAYMVIKYYKPGDLVIFCDTSREHPKTYKFLNDFEAFEGIPIIRLKWKGMENTFDSLLCSKKYKVIPNRMKRICTVELKINTQKAYLRSIGILSFENIIGFRPDEKRRVLASRANQKFKKVHNKFPLYDDNINKAVVVDYWKNKPYSLEIPSILGNCT